MVEGGILGPVLEDDDGSAQAVLKKLRQELNEKKAAAKEKTILTVSEMKKMAEDKTVPECEPDSSETEKPSS